MRERPERVDMLKLRLPEDTARYLPKVNYARGPPLPKLALTQPVSASLVLAINLTGVTVYVPAFSSSDCGLDAQLYALMSAFNEESRPTGHEETQIISTGQAEPS